MAKRETASGPGAAELIEEAVHLLRRQPRALAMYYLGTGPFALGLLYYWAYVTWFVPLDGEVALGALLLVGLFAWMKTGQNRFAQILWAQRTGEPVSGWTWREWPREMLAQLRLQAAGMVAVPLAAVFGVPFAWVYGYYQNLTVLPASRNGEPVARAQEAVDLVKLWPVQNHWALAILGMLWLMMLLNIAVAFYMVPALITRWLGIPTVFSLAGWSYWNTTNLAFMTVLTHLLVDPLIKGYYVLRVFHGQSRQTGADLRLVLRREVVLRGRSVMGLVVVLTLFLFASPDGVAAEASLAPAQSTAAPTALLNPALDRVLAQPEFRWRLRPPPTPPQKEKEGIIKGFVRSTFDLIQEMTRTVYRWYKEVGRWLGEFWPEDKRSDETDGARGAHAGDGFAWMALLQLVAYALLVAIAGVLIFVIYKVVRQNRAARPLVSRAIGLGGPPDLRDETVEASQLPADGWLELARQQLAAGEWRLALRAVFLATLASHAREGLLALAKFKTNLDYETEIRRRVHGRPMVVEEFRAQRLQFEEVWYGSAAADAAVVRLWLQKMEGRS